MHLILTVVGPIVLWWVVECNDHGNPCDLVAGHVIRIFVNSIYNTSGIPRMECVCHMTLHMSNKPTMLHVNEGGVCVT